ncbi:unnamed protein product [Paramecium octaurelia]|uniref:Uncharacterized protein n=1 Tax=Paramecium octaurelia TaxID=43137 RepID=A0A8S1XYG8_PAROT|nr:unnamed protein product [Paramecium octaurelia]
MSKTRNYGDETKSIISEIRNQIHLSFRKNRFQIKALRMNDSEIQSNLLCMRSNRRSSIKNSSTLKAKRKLTLQPLKTNLLGSANLEQRLRKDNKEKLMKMKKM